MVDASMNESLVAPPVFPLYDPVCMLDISREVASGYLVLLLGGTTPSPQKKRRGKRDRSLVAAMAEPEIDDDVVALAFLSLTDGNVVNACFGAPTQLCDALSPAYVMAQNAKRELANAADSSDAVRKLAVQSYAAGFRIVRDYNEQLARMDPCTRCCKQSVLHKTAEEDLKIAFRTLSEAVATAT